MIQPSSPLVVRRRSVPGLKRVRDAFLAFAAAEPVRYATVDATRDEDAVLADAIATLDRIADRAPCLRTAVASPP